MKRLLSIFFSFTFIITFTNYLALADYNDANSSEFVNGIMGEYYDSQIDSNESAKRLTRIDNGVSFNWLKNSPDSTIEQTTFSVKWTGYIQVPITGVYTFITYSDDGVSLDINNQNIINKWGFSSLQFNISNPIELKAGVKYKFKMQYQQIQSNSIIFLFWTANGGAKTPVPENAFFIEKTIYDTYKNPVYSNPVKGAGDGLIAKYYKGANGVTTSSPVITKNIDCINFNWGISSPDINKLDDKFSASYEGYIEAKYTEKINLIFKVDDGIKVWIDNKLVLNKWIPNNEVIYAVPVDMTVGSFHKLKIYYNDMGGGASISLGWQSAAQESQIIPKKYLYTVIPNSN